MFNALRPSLFHAATDDLPPGGADGDPPPGGDTPPAPPAPPAGDAPPAPVSAFRPPAGTPPPGDTPPARPEWCPESNWDAEAGAPIVPEKFWDKEAGAAKADALAKSYRELERRMGAAADLPPKDASGYEFEKRDGEALEVPAEIDEAIRDFAAEIKLTNQQYNEIVRELYATANDAVAGSWAANEQRTLADLKTQHGADAAKVQADAWKVAQTYLSAEELGQLEKAPSSAVVMNLLARVARELRPDGSPGAGGTPPASFDVMTSEAIALRRNLDSEFWQSHKPGHAAAVAKVQAWEAECIRRGVSSRELLESR